ncbi:MAG TPA: DUF4082 domain-containing protein [Caulobacteraceae bacterium]
MKLKTVFAAGAAIASLCATAAVHAAPTLAFTPNQLQGPADYQPNIPVNLAMVFTANSNTNATALGFYDLADATGSEDVGLYDSTGNLLSSVSVAASAGNVISGYHFANIAPVALTAGDTYAVVAQVFNNPWQYGTINSSPSVTFNFDAYDYVGALHDWTNTNGSGPAYFGPNLLVASVPEPATWAMMLIGASLIGAGLRIGRGQAAPARA